MNKIFGFIGMGNMGSTMLKGASNVFSKEDIVFSEANKEKMHSFSKEIGVECVESNAQCVEDSKYVILAVKPQYMQEVLDEIKDRLTSEQVVISIAAGKTLAYFAENLPDYVRVIRAMPNTPALVNEGMTGICYDHDKFSDEEIATVNKFFNSFGKVVTVDENMMDAVVCASGSSPAYVYMFIEALADSVVKYGIKRDMAYELVAQTVLGSAKMVLETKEHPGLLKDKVCSPGGTTIAGVAALEECGFRNAVIKATDKCYEKCTKM